MFSLTMKLFSFGIVYNTMQNMNNLVANGLVTLKKDIEYGLENEQPVVNHLEIHFKEPIKLAEYKYSPFDAYSETTKYEIKSRRNRHDKYKTTIIGCDKARTQGRLCFVFHFTDGLFYIIYDKEKFEKYNITNVSGVRKVGLRTEKPHYEIPIEDLTRINI